MRRLNATFLGVFLLVCNCAAQEAFHFKRNINGVERQGWHAMTLPPDIFRQLNTDFSDIRIFHIKRSDTLEVPYVLDVQVNVETTDIVSLPVLNKSYGDDALYLMFELNPSQQVNHLQLDFAERNYFGRVTLQGSDNRHQWFDIISDQRIVSVHKAQGDDYTLSRIDFPLTNYRFLRVRVEADVPLTFQGVSFHHNQVRKGNFRNMPLTWQDGEDERTRQTVVDIRLRDYAPVSFIRLKTDSTRDYYRPLRIEYVADSFKTDKGWIKSYETLHTGHLTSFRENAFSFPWRLSREIRIVVTNFDDQPIPVRDVSVAGPAVQVVANLEPGTNIMLHGAGGLRAPSYDLAHFQSRIPDSLAVAKLANAEALIPSEKATEGLFQSKLWLWAVMAVMIVGLGLFTIKMMRQ